MESMETAQLQSNSHKNWHIKDDLYILKNWSMEDNEIGLKLGRTNLAIDARRRFLNSHPSRFKEVQRTFPDAVIPEIVQKPAPKSKRHYKKRTVKLDYSSFTVPKSIIEKYGIKDSEDKFHYSVKEQLFIIKNIKAPNKSLANALSRTDDAISVQKGKIRRKLQDPNSDLTRILADLNMVPARTEEVTSEEIMNSPLIPPPIMAQDQSKVLSIGFESVDIDWENKRLLFKIQQ